MHLAQHRLGKRFQKARGPPAWWEEGPVASLIQPRKAHSKLQCLAGCFAKRCLGLPLPFEKANTAGRRQKPPISKGTDHLTPPPCKDSPVKGSLTHRKGMDLNFKTTKLWLQRKISGNYEILVAQLYLDAKKWIIRSRGSKDGQYLVLEFYKWSQKNTGIARHLCHFTKSNRLLTVWDFILFYFQRSLKRSSQQYIFVFSKFNVLVLRNQKLPWHSKTYWLGVNWSEIFLGFLMIRYW